MLLHKIVPKKIITKKTYYSVVVSTTLLVSRLHYEISVELGGNNRAEKVLSDLCEVY